MRHPVLSFLPLLLCWLVAPSPALTQPRTAPKPLPPGSTLILLPGGDLEGVSPSSHLAAASYEKSTRAALLEAIDQIGYHALTAEKARSELIKRGKLSLCRAVMSCDRRSTLEELDAAAVVVYALWLRDNEPAQLTVTVTRVDFEGSSNKTVDKRSLRNEAKALFASALTKAERENRILVQIDSTPPGATVTVDQRYTKTTPAQFDLLPGAHQVVAEKEGYVTLLDGFELEAEDTVYRQTLNMEAVETPRARTASGDDESLADVAYAGPNEGGPSATTDHVVGGVLAAAAVGLVTVGVVMALQDGDCSRKASDDACVLRKDSGAYPFWLIGGGVSALGSAGMFIFTPFASLVDGSAGLQLSGTF